MNTESKAEMLKTVFVDMYENEMQETIEEPIKALLVWSLDNARTLDGKKLDLDKLLQLAYSQNVGFRTFMSALTNLLVAVNEQGLLTKEYAEKYKKLLV